MDVLPSYQLQKYDEILNEINREHEQSLKLRREIQQMDDLITFLKLSLLSCQKKISHVNVKVFKSVTEIENLYDLDNVNCSVRANNDCKFFLIEVFLMKTLLSKMNSIEWKLQLTVQTESVTASKVVKVNTEKNSILEVIPFDNNQYECCVTACLFQYSEDHWNIVDLCSVDVDISYYFESCTEKNSNLSSNDFLNITQLYTNALNCIKTPLELQNQLKCDLTQNTFISEFVKNSYHRLCLESFSNFVNDSNRRIIDLQFCIDGEKIVMLYHKESKILKIKAESNKAASLKKFFVGLFQNDWKGFRDKFKKIISKEPVKDMDLDEILLKQQQLKKLWL